MMDRHRGSRTAASPGAHVETRSSGRQARRRALDEPGQTTLEFLLLAPVLLTIALGVMVFGLALNNYLELTYATNAAAQFVSISRGITSPSPCTTASSAGASAAPLLKSPTPTFNYAFSGGSCTNLISGQTVTVTATYPCKLVVMGVNYAPSGCTLSAQSAMIIQ